jgi:hypothetical protein
LEGGVDAGLGDVIGVDGLPFVTAYAAAGVVEGEEGFCFADSGVRFGSADGVDIQEPMMGDATVYRSKYLVFYLERKVKSVCRYNWKRAK